MPGSAPTANGGWRVSCDFDGTITCDDVVQSMLAEFADPSWRVIEAEWEAGLIGSRICLQRQTELLRVEPERLAAWVDTRPVDPHVSAFFADCAGLGLDVRIVSDGYDWVIRRVVARLGLAAVPIFANRLTPRPGGRWSVQFPHARRACSSGACKCAVIAEGRPRLHIGDGRSDMCVSDVCEVVFAKGALLASRTARGLASIPFTSFADIREALPEVTGVRREGDAALPASPPPAAVPLQATG